MGMKPHTASEYIRILYRYKRNGNTWYHRWSFIDDLQTYLFKPAHFGTYPKGEQIDALASLHTLHNLAEPRTPREN